MTEKQIPKKPKKANTSYCPSTNICTFRMQEWLNVRNSKICKKKKLDSDSVLKMDSFLKA